MSYLLQGVEDALETLVPTTLARGPGMLNRWRGWRTMLVNRIGVPIDQSGFDEVPWMDLIEEAIRWMCSQAIKASREPDVHMRVMELVVHRLREASVQWKGHTWKYVRGILSGWRWTSVLDTLINFVELLAVFHIAGVSLPSREEMALQGDDVLAFLHSWGDAYSVVREYERILPVNPKKFFVDPTRTEYLRLVLDRAGRSGYLVRAVGSVCYANAWAGGTVTAASIAASWSTLAGRGANMQRLRVHVKRDLCGHLRVSTSTVEELLRTPLAVGGLGFDAVTSNPLEPRRWKRLRTPELLNSGERWEKREQRKTDVERVPLGVRSAARINMATRSGLVGKDSELAEAAAESLLEAVGGYGALDASREVVERVQYPSGPNADHYRKGAHRPPRLLVDRMFIKKAIVKKMGRGWDAVSGLFHPSDRDMAKDKWITWSRNVWIDWVTGSLVGTCHASWGMGGDLQGEVADAMAELGIIPYGRVTRTHLRRRLLELEFKSEGYTRDDRGWARL
jgi:hypothetical protein